MQLFAVISRKLSCEVPHSLHAIRINTKREMRMGVQRRPKAALYLRVLAVSALLHTLTWYVCRCSISWYRCCCSCGSLTVCILHQSRLVQPEIDEYYSERRRRRRTSDVVFFLQRGWDTANEHGRRPSDRDRADSAQECAQSDPSSAFPDAKKCQDNVSFSATRRVCVDAIVFLNNMRRCWWLI